MTVHPLESSQPETTYTHTHIQKKINPVGCIYVFVAIHVTVIMKEAITWGREHWREGLEEEKDSGICDIITLTKNVKKN